MSGVGPRNHLRITKTRISRQLLRPATVPNKPEIELLEAERRLLTFAESYDKAPETATLNAIWERARETAKSASGSWLGYHANMYYKDFRPPPAGVHFDVDSRLQLPPLPRNGGVPFFCWVSWL